MTFVTDASVAAAWVLPDEEAAIADLALERLGEETVKVPNVFWIDSFAQNPQVPVRREAGSASRRGRVFLGHDPAFASRSTSSRRGRWRAISSAVSPSSEWGNLIHSSVSCR